MRALCFGLALLSMLLTVGFMLAGMLGLTGVGGTDLGSGNQWYPLADVFGTLTIAWMVGAIAFRPSARD